MATTYTLIASSTVGSGGASSIDFTSIPSTYTDLCLKISARLTVTGVGTIRMKLNTDTGTNYNWRFIQANGASASSDKTTSAVASSANEIALVDGSDSTSNTFSNSDLYLPNYTSSNSKSWSVDSVEEENATTAYIRLTAGLWSGTAAINAISLTTSSGNFAQYSTAYLYGISNS